MRLSHFNSAWPECHEDKLNHWPDLGLDSLAVAAVGGWSG
jgi:hypothetical protein